MNGGPISFLWRWRLAGNHVHVDVFAGSEPGHRGRCGVLAFRIVEWEAIVPVLEAAGYDIERSGSVHCDTDGEPMAQPSLDNWQQGSTKGGRG